MKRFVPLALLSLTAQAPLPKPAALSPNEIAAAAPAADWVAIAPSDLLVMDLPPLDAKPRRVVIQLMPPPFSQGWVGNIRKLAAARWWDGTSINRVQDNYVVQWGDATEKKALPPGLAVIPESEYSVKSRSIRASPFNTFLDASTYTEIGSIGPSLALSQPNGINRRDQYAVFNGFDQGWPFASSLANAWPTHCYAMVGVGRDLPPNTGSGAELYAVIGHAPRHLDRNIALVGRVIEGIEHLSSLPRGTGPLGFYEKAKERVPILSVRIGSEIADLPRFEYLSTESVSFARYADARANRRDAFFIQPAGGADICNIPVPARRAK